MLTGDLVRVRSRSGRLRPSVVDTSDEALLEAAGQLCDTFAEAAEGSWRRCVLQDAIDDVVGDRRDHKVVRGFAKLLFDRAKFAVDTAVPPADLRWDVFQRARSGGGVALAPGALERPVAADVLAAVGEAHGLDAAQVGGSLYADLPDEQRLVTSAAVAPDWLLRRYNVALFQAVLLKASEVTVTLQAPTVPRVRQLLRWVKFRELMHHARREGDALVLTLDGPTSLFAQSTRYGLQLAGFFPALLLQDGDWTMTADVRWRNRDLALVVTRKDGLVSHYRDTGAYETRTHEWFVQRFAAKPRAWTLDRRVSPIDLGGRSVVLPDYRLRCGDRVAYVEIVGFWRKDWLARRIRALRDHGPGNLILAVSKRLGGKDALTDFAGAVVPFAQVVPVAEVLAAAEELAISVP